jgi:hypothetical protein
MILIKIVGKVKGIPFVQGMKLGSGTVRLTIALCSRTVFLSDP